jgi:hypothetical protein
MPSRASWREKYLDEVPRRTSSRLVYAVGSVELGLGLLCLVVVAFGFLVYSQGGHISGSGLVTVLLFLPTGAAAMLGGFAARRGWRRWYAYACLPVLTAPATVVALHIWAGFSYQ